MVVDCSLLTVGTVVLVILHSVGVGTTNLLAYSGLLTLKKFQIEPSFTVPYSISVCVTKSSAEFTFVEIRWMVKKAAKLAVYDANKNNANSHQTADTMRPDKDLKLGKCTSRVPT